MHLAPGTISLALDQEVSAFLADRQARGLAPGSVRFYAQKLSVFRGGSR